MAEKHITAQEELELLRQAKGLCSSGDPVKQRKAAIAKLLAAHSPFIVTIVRGYMLPPGVEYEDALAEAKVGFIDAIDRYNVDSGYRINTFAIYRVKKAIEDFLTQMGYATKIPFPEVVKTRRLLLKNDVNLMEASREELIEILKAAEMLVDETAPTDQLRKRAEVAIHGNKNVNIASLIKGTMSVHARDDSEEGRVLDQSNYVEARMAAPDVATDVISHLTIEEIEEAIAKLPMMEALPLLYGLGMIDEAPVRLKKSAARIGAPYNLTEHCYRNAVDQARTFLRSLKEQ